MHHLANVVVISEHLAHLGEVEVFLKRGRLACDRKQKIPEDLERNALVIATTSSGGIEFPLELLDGRCEVADRHRDGVVGRREDHRESLRGVLLDHAFQERGPEVLWYRGSRRRQEVIVLGVFFRRSSSSTWLRVEELSLRPVGQRSEVGDGRGLDARPAVGEVSCLVSLDEVFDFAAVDLRMRDTPLLGRWRFAVEDVSHSSIELSPGGQKRLVDRGDGYRHAELGVLHIDCGLS